MGAFGAPCVRDSGAEILKLEVETGIIYRQLRLANSQETEVLRGFEGF
jgi:hypothetical protein